MKVKSVEKFQTPESIKHEISVKGNRKCIITEGSLLDCGENTKEKFQSFFDKPPLIDLSEIGMIVIDSDDRFHSFLRKANSNSELDQIDNKTFKTVINEHTGNSKVRTTLKESLGDITSTRLGLIVDSVEDDFASVTSKKKQLESMGYDCMVCFVNLSLNEVLDRCSGEVTDDQAKMLWKETQKNIARYAEEFGGNIVVINGNDSEKFVKGIEFAVEQFVTEPVKNTVGQNLMIRSRTVHSGE